MAAWRARPGGWSVCSRTRKVDKSGSRRCKKVRRERRCGLRALGLRIRCQPGKVIRTQDRLRVGRGAVVASTTGTTRAGRAKGTRQLGGQEEKLGG